MSDNNVPKPKKSFSADWLVGGVLTKIGDTLDKLTGRGWKPSSSLATSELIERLKKLLDAEVRDLGDKGRFVPHNIKLKMQWNKFSTDSEVGLRKLEYEMMAAAIDHINDNRYHTYKPLKIEIKPDYFTEGIKFLASFGEFDEEEKEAVVDVTVPQMNVKNLIPEEIKTEPEAEEYVAEFTANDKPKTVELKFLQGKRLSVGRTKENDLCIEDASVSKIHAALVVNAENQLIVADTGSTNGTFINGQRIAYGRGFPISESDKLKFGTIEVYLRRVPKPTDFATSQSYQTETAQPENYAGNQGTANITNQEVNQNTMQAFETNRDYITDKKDELPKAHPSDNHYPVNPVQNNAASETVSVNKTEAPIPVSPPQPNLITAQDYQINPVPKAEPQKAENETNFSESEKQSQVFPTEPRVKFNFDDDEKK